MQFEFNNNTKNVIKDFISNIRENIEVEIRFGIFKYNQNTKKSEFKSGINTDIFYKLKMAFDKQDFKKTVINTNEFIYDINNQKIKKIVENGNETYVNKNTIKKYDIYDYDFRIAISSEKNVKNIKIDDKVPNLIRNKERYSYKLPIGKFDLTIVNNEYYEAELEIETKNHDSVLSFVQIILQIINDNYYIISNGEKTYVFNEYKNIIKSRYFIGAQPETLQKSNISNLYKELYSVTDKADGDRMFMLIDNSKYIYIIDNNMNNVYKTDITSNNYYSCIIDGECIKKNNKIYFYAFDLIAYNGLDIRGNTKYKLRERLDRLNDIIKNISKGTEKYIVNMKKFYYKNVFLGSEVLLENKHEIYENDGLIYTPMNEPYPLTKKWSKLLKWKPDTLNTIDFYAIKDDTNNIWKLYVQHNVQNTEQNTKNLVLFDIKELCETNDKVDVITYETHIDPNAIDPTTNESYKSNTVIEFKWDNKVKKFIPLRTRWDKTINPKKHGNFSVIACDIWNNIQNPINKELLFKFTTFNKNDFFFERMKKFHNKIKEYLYNTYSNNCEYLLELCAGRGGDLHKWKYNNIKNIDCYDNSEKNILECQKRIEQMNFDKNCNIYLNNLDINKTNSSNIILKNAKNKYNTISCQFGLHYFFQNEESIDNILNIFEQNIKNNGCILLTFIDNIELESFFNNRKYVVEDYNNEIVYYLKRDVVTNKIKIILNGNNILGEGSEEFIIDFDYLVNKMNDRQFELIDTKLFKDFQCGAELSKYEKDISYLNRYCVFRKKDCDDLPIIKQNNNINCSINIPESIQLTEYTNLIKICNNKDVLEIINCIEYKYNYNNNYKDIINFDDIVNVFKEYNIKYNAVFVENPYEFNMDLYNTIYFTFYKHTVEKTQNCNENLVYNNWYLIIINDNIVNTFDTIKNISCEKYNKNIDDIEDKNIDDIEDKNIDDIEDKNIDNIEDKNIDDIKDKNIDDIKDKNVNNFKNNKFDAIRKELDEKITIIKLKEYLKEYNLKISGTKNELIDRLKDYINKK